MTMTTEKLAELKRLAKQATPGPWTGGNDVYQSDGVGHADRVCKGVSEKDSLYIAAANPQTILSLIALAERALQLSGNSGELPELPEPNSYCTHADSHEYDVFDAKQMREYALTALAAEAQARGEYAQRAQLLPPEPDWTDSKTLCSSPWKNPLVPMGDRLQIADGAVRFRDDVIANLRKQLAEARGDGAQPEEEKALPLWKAEKSHDLARAYDENGDEIAGGYAKEVFAFVEAHNASMRAYASQLALPAGPVPEGLITKERQCLALWEAIKAIKIGNKTDDKLIVSELHKAGYYIAKVPSPAVAQHAQMAHASIERAQKSEKFAHVAPAVAQPVADEQVMLNAERYQWVRKTYIDDEYSWPNGLRYATTEEQFDAAIDAARAALCQPADEGGNGE